MKVTTGTGYGALSGNLVISDKFELKTSLDFSEYDIEVIRYAIMRFMRKNKIMMDKYITASYKKRLSKGVDRKASYDTIDIPAKILELPGARALINVTISDNQIVIDRLEVR